MVPGYVSTAMTQVRRLAALVATALVVGRCSRRARASLVAHSFGICDPHRCARALGASVTPEASIAVATAQIATVHPDTFQPLRDPDAAPPATPYPSPQPAELPD